MATKNQRVVAYLPPDAYDWLSEFATSRGLTESKAFIQILEAYRSGTSQHTQPAHQLESSTPKAISNSTLDEGLQKRLEDIERRLGELRA